MYSHKTPKDIYIKLVSFFQARKANKYRAQLDQDSSDFKENVKEEIQQSESQEFEARSNSDHSIDIDSELHKLGIPNIDEIEENTHITSKLKNFIQNIRKKIKQKFQKATNLHPQNEKDARSQPNILPVKVIKGEIKSRVDKSQAISSMLAQRLASTASSRESARESITKNMAAKMRQNSDVTKLAVSEKELVKKDVSSGQRNSKAEVKNDPRDINKDGKVDNQEKAVKDADKKDDLHRKFHADAVNNIGENQAKSQWVGALSDTAVKGKGGDGGRSV
ncbi:MAG: hypothetical protein HOM96_05690 [Rickettsiales bacterium]|jgi:hypothetical protein|nr:hypothetical protein [Rickettsiales bacterium]